ncbi:MAG TPA: Uma2 family endonuclease [Ktedonobacterales bacterium]|jgi:Uma2 family endonuclease
MSKAAYSQPPNSSEPPAKLTYEQFLEWADEDTLAEWVDGAIVMTSPASLRHQDIINFLVGVLSTFTTVHSLGHIVDGPFQMKLERSGREPDILYIAKAHLSRLKATYLDGPADLVVEVVSPESAGRDRGDKFYEYRQAGIPEYWLIDPTLEQAEFYQLDKAKRYQLIAADADGIYRSKVLSGFWLRVGWLWQEPPPDVVKALLEIDRDAYARYLQEQLKQAGL